MTDNLKRSIRNEDIEAQLERLLSSPEFGASPRGRKLISHLVTMELQGQGDQLHGTALAMDVFDRGGEFDPNNDPVVRVEAGKLRKALEVYYLKAGPEDEIEISVPKGQYRPSFARRTGVAVARAQDKPPVALPTLGVLEFSGTDAPGAMLYRVGLPEELGLELARFSNIRVLAVLPGDALEASDHSDGGVLSACQYLLTGAVLDGGDAFHLSVRLNKRSSGELIWAFRSAVAADGSNAFEVQSAIAQDCATKLADAYGVLSNDAAGMSTEREGAVPNVYRAVLALHSHLRLNRVSSLEEFLTLAKGAVDEDGKSGLAHALYALALLESAMMGQAPFSDVIAQGQPHAERAIALSPKCQEALFAAATYARLGKDMARFDRLIDAAIAANPNGTLLIAMAGGWIAVTGDAPRGADLVRQATAKNPLLPIWTRITLSLEQIDAGNFAEASDLVHDLDARDSIGDWIVIFAAHTLAGQDDRAHSAVSHIVNGAIDMRGFVDLLGLTDDLEKKLLASIQGRVPFDL